MRPTPHPPPELKRVKKLKWVVVCHAFYSLIARDYESKAPGPAEARILLGPHSHIAPEIFVNKKSMISYRVPQKTHKSQTLGVVVLAEHL